MFYKDEIQSLIKVLQERNVSFYHACQLDDLRSYLTVQGIPARSLLSEKGLSFTPFKSDVNDRKTGDWNRVFLNMNDFGNFFHSGSNSLPNVFGPILFKLNPDCIEDASDVAICLCSAGSEGFNRQKFSLKNIEAVEKLFKFSKLEKGKSSWFNSIGNLKKEFSEIPVKSFPEVSCTISVKLIKLDYITQVIVDPLELNGISLFDQVKTSLEGFDKILGSMTVRSSKNQKKYLSLVKAIAKGDTIQNLANNSELDTWANEIAKNKLEYQYTRFAEYILTGTLNKMPKAV